jgi:hypothetical protein
MCAYGDVRAQSGHGTGFGRCQLLTPSLHQASSKMREEATASRDRSGYHAKAEFCDGCDNHDKHLKKLAAISAIIG